MQALLDICCGLDVHKDSVVACIIKSIPTDTSTGKEETEVEIKTYSTLLSDPVQLKGWIVENGCRNVAMESTGVYWYPVFETLETAFDGEITILVANARHMRNVPGRKTDIKDAQWIASLLRAGLLNGSFIPDADVRELRQLSRYRRNIVQDVSRQKNRIEKTLQQAGFKLSSFLSDIFGVSGRNLISVIIKKGRVSPLEIDSETKKLSPSKKEEMKFALNGRLSVHQRDFLKLELEHLDLLLAHQNKIESAIFEKTKTFSDAVERLDTIPGIATVSAISIIAEIGTDMNKFPTAEHFCSWAGLSPGNYESAGKKKAHASHSATLTLKD